MNKKSPDAVDTHVGSRIRMRRIAMGMSQERLGEALGLTFQQVQKYEKGANRIGAGRLYATANALGVDVAFFFQGLESRHKKPAAPSLLVETRDGARLMKAFAEIRDTSVKRRTVELVEAMASSLPSQSGG